MLDLSALEEKPAAWAIAANAKPSGAPWQIPLADIEEDPGQVEAWCADQTEVTRKSVSELADELKGKKKPVQEPSGDRQEADSITGAEADKFGHDQISGVADGARAGGFSSESDNGNNHHIGNADDDIGQQTDERTSEPGNRAFKS